MATIEQVLAAYRSASDKFIAKVKDGRARSVETYAELSAAVELHDSIVTKPHIEVRTVARRDWGCYEEVQIYVDGERICGGSFGGEPEDNTRFRDYSWVDDAIAAIAEKLGATVEFTDTAEEGSSDA